MMGRERGDRARVLAQNALEIIGGTIIDRDQFKIFECLMRCGHAARQMRWALSDGQQGRDCGVVGMVLSARRAQYPRSHRIR